MKPLLLILTLAVTASAQGLSGPDWKLIKEMSGSLTEHNNLPVKTYGAQIARNGDIVKISVRVDFPDGAPYELFKDNVEKGFDVTSIERIIGRVELNCRTLIVKPFGRKAEIYQFNGTKHTTNEPPFKLDSSGNLFASYFCEKPSESPTSAPQLKKASP